MNTQDFKRKLTAIFSADAAGYSRLMAEDEGATVKTLEAYKQVMFSLVKQHRGRVVDSPGDNILAEFASVVDAVRCGVAIQNELHACNAGLPENRKMQFRIGINLGDVIEEGARIYGDGVNIAARLESMTESGGICISGTVYDQVKNKVGLEYEYLGEKTVKNMTDPVRIYRVLSSPDAATRRMIKAKIEKMAFPLPEKPSIAVLPFTNMSGDPTQEYIGDGITENIISALSISSGMFVIARNSTFTYKGRPVRVQQVAEELGVRYVLEGSVQKSGARLRVTAQLIDAISGHHIWSEKCDRRMGELFDLQDEITKRIVVSLHVELTHGDQVRLFAKSTENLEAWGYGVKGDSFLDKFNKEDNIKARELFEAAIDLDPGYVLAYVWLGATHTLDTAYGWSEDPSDSFKLAHELAQKALALDDKSAGAHTLLGLIYRSQGQHDKAIAEGKLAVSLAPNMSIGYAHLAGTVFFSGQFEEAIELMKKAMRLSPYYPAFYLDCLCRSHAFMARYEEAVTTCEQLYKRSRRGEYPVDWGLTHLAGIYIEVGREEEARDLITEALKINPGISLESYKKGQHFRNPDHLQRELDVLTKAGMK
jgi:adenylate cyclase